jgi:hypothetical protein
MVAATFILILIGLRSWSGGWFGRDVVTKPSPRPLAGALRERAARECAHDEWAACASDLKSASALDPAGDTPSLLELREKAERRVHEFDATPKP